MWSLDVHVDGALWLPKDGTRKDHTSSVLALCYVPSSFLLPVVRPGATSISFLAPFVCHWMMKNDENHDFPAEQPGDENPTAVQDSLDQLPSSRSTTAGRMGVHA